MHNTVCIDFDGVIARYNGWKGIGNFGEPLDGIGEALQALRAAGKTIIIFTTRGEVETIQRYMESNALYYDYINHNPKNALHMNDGKPIADVYVDDRALTFRGKWDAEFVEAIIKHKPWYETDIEGLEQELCANLLDLANYCIMTHMSIAGSEGSAEDFDKVTSLARFVFSSKNKSYGSNFFKQGIGNAFNDIRRKYIRIENMVGEIRRKF